MMILESRELHGGLRLRHGCAAKPRGNKCQGCMHGPDLDEVRGLYVVLLKVVAKETASAALVIMTRIANQSLFMN